MTSNTTFSSSSTSTLAKTWSTTWKWTSQTLSDNCRTSSFNRSMSSSPKSRDTMMSQRSSPTRSCSITSTTMIEMKTSRRRRRREEPSTLSCLILKTSTSCRRREVASFYPKTEWKSRGLAERQINADQVWNPCTEATANVVWASQARTSRLMVKTKVRRNCCKTNSARARRYISNRLAT